MIRGGRVSRNGGALLDTESPARMPDGRVDDHIGVDGSPLDKAPPLYLVMNKPRGVVTTASDEQGRETMYDLLEPWSSWVGPGRKVG